MRWICGRWGVKALLLLYARLWVGLLALHCNALRCATGSLRCSPCGAGFERFAMALIRAIP